jgi:hypothetical protein
LEKISTAFFEPKPAPVIMGLRIVYKWVGFFLFNIDS